MSYLKLEKLCNIIDNQSRQDAFIKFYKNKTLNGLHYVNFSNDTQTISISRPDHSTHHEATSYLLLMKHGTKSINTVLNNAQYVKKFLDFLLIWDIDINNGDLLLIMTGFVEHLKCLRRSNPPQYKSIQWSIVTSVPLHDRALYENVVGIGKTSDGFMAKTKWEDLSYEMISQSLSGAIDYLKFLKERSSAHAEINLNQLPHRKKSHSSMLSGTLGPTQIEVVDTNLILNLTGLKYEKVKASLSLELKVFTELQCKSFISAIEPNNHQDKLLFYILEHFGIRRGEAVNILIDTSTLPKDMLRMSDSLLYEYLKKNLKGDLEYSEVLNRWVLSVVERDNKDSRSQHKTGSRQIPHDFNNDILTSLLANALKHRTILERYCEDKNCCLFVSQKNGYKGNPISGNAVYDKFTRVAYRLYKDTGIDLRDFNPHSFRHYFATYQLRIRHRSIDDVSNWLGHSTPDVTRDIYIHYMPTDYKHKNTVEEMKETFKSNDRK